MTKVHPISIVIRTLNEERWLEPLVTRLREQSRTDSEIIVVDSGSIDDTLPLARRLCDKVIEIHGDAFSYGHALNIGIAEASAPLVAILSAHTLPIARNWLEALASPFGHNITESGIALTYGLQRGNHLTKLSEQTDFERQYPVASKKQSGKDYFCNNANAMIRRDLWEKYPFDQTLPGLEDMAWSRHWMEQGFSIQYCADAGIFHIHEETWPQVRRRFRREAQTARMVGLPTPSPLRVMTSECGHLLTDLLRATRQGGVGEVLRYRFWKARGTVEGLRTVGHRRDAADVEPGQTYSALEISSQNHADIVAKPLPELRPNEVLIRVSYVGICQTDIEVFRLTLGYFKDGTAKLPLVPGHEYSGVIVRRGANVQALEVGDQVVGECILSCGICADCLANRTTACRQRREVGVVNYNGACAEYLVLPARFVHRLPPDCSPLSACSVEPLAVVLKGLRRIGLRNVREIGRRRVLVIGAGAIGNLASQVAAHLGHRVTVVDHNTARLQHLQDVCETLTARPSPPNFDFVIEATGLSEMAEFALRDTPTGSDVLLLGFPYGPLQWNPEDLVARDKRVVGSVGSDYETFEAAIKLLPRLDLAPFNSKVVELRDWQAAYRLHESKQYLKVKLAVRAAAPDTSELVTSNIFTPAAP